MTWIVGFISGPLTDGGTLGKKHIEANVRIAMAAQRDLWSMGIACHCPHLSWFSHQVYPEQYETYMKNCFALIAKSDFVWRLPGDSAGSDRECLFAINRGMKVFKTRQAIEERFQLDAWSPA